MADPTNSDMSPPPPIGPADDQTTGKPARARLHRTIARARRRILLRRALSAGTWSITGGLGALLTLVLIERVLAAAIPWNAALWIVGIGAILAGWAWVLAGLPSRMAAARELDERADLRDALSTVLSLEGDDSAWARLVTDTAEARARTLKVREAMPLRRPVGLPASLGTGAALALAWLLLPTLDVLGSGEQRARDERNDREIRQVRQQLEDQHKQLDDMVRDSELSLGEERDTFEGDLPEDPESAEDLQRARVRQLTNLSEQIEQRKRGLDAKRAEAIEQSLKQLRQPGRGPMSELSRQLARGQTSEASRSLENLAERVASGRMDADSRTRAGEQARDLSEQLAKLGEQGGRAKEELREQLGRMGLSEAESEALLEDPQALEQALESMEGLTPEQLEQLNDLASQMEAGERMQQMSRSLERLAEALESGEISQQQLNEAVRRLQAQCEAREGLQQKMQKLAQAEQMANRELARLSNKLGTGRNQGKQAVSQPGGAEAGRGSVESEGMHLNTFADRDERSPVKSQSGPIIASTLINGPQVRGESRADFAEAASRAAQAASEAIDTRAVPRDRQDVVKHYFGSLEKSRGSERGERAEGATSTGDDG